MSSLKPTILSQIITIISLVLLLSYTVNVIGETTAASEDEMCSTTSSDDNSDNNNDSCIIESRSKIVAREKFSTETTISSNDDGFLINRRRFPEEDPLVCLAFLSCCGRTNLLEETLKGIIRHMEEDEPKGLKYEIAWVDNGSGTKNQQYIANKFQIEHAVTLKENMGLAWGMNALIFDMCTAPYIMLLEEDWLYMDEAVVPQSLERKISIALGLSVLMSNPIDSQTGKPIKGFFLRVENSITRDRNIGKTMTRIPGSSDQQLKKISYFTSCMDFDKNGHIFGAFTNGAGIYDRGIFSEVGRMYGEPGDIFNEVYVEGNYAFRVGLKYCGARMSLEPCHGGALSQCCASFAHIGGGHNTRPNRKNHIDCMDVSWNFYGTPYYDVYPKEECSDNIGNISIQLKKNAEFMEWNAEHNKEVFEREKVMREELRDIAKSIEESRLNFDPAKFRAIYGAANPDVANFSDEEVLNFPSKLRLQADSAHQLPGFWDALGRPIGLDY